LFFAGRSDSGSFSGVFGHDCLPVFYAKPSKSFGKYIYSPPKNGISFIFRSLKRIGTISSPCQCHDMGVRGTTPFVFSLFPAIRYFSCFCSKSTCHDQGQIKPKKRGHVTQLFSRHGRILVLEVSRPILTEISRRLLSLVPCECMKRSIPICYGNSFAKCANQTSRSPRSRGI